MSERPDQAGQPSALPTERALLAVLSLGAAAIHFAVAPEHFAEYAPFGLLFTIVAWFQAITAAALVYTSRPGRLVAGVAAAVNLGTVLVWALSRTAGLPVGDEPWTPEPVGTADVVAGVLEIALVAGLGLLAMAPASAGPFRADTPALRALRIACAAGAILATGYAIASLAPGPMSMAGG
jgi:hypothetical protein